ncbi:PstS family phosphate ABC transporter substrate-binding protein [Sphingobacterium sp. BN32]|uniref:PstS family phosphate ABC transporter substrate-binding protein n=1 Tax=Sphingobacterium sp. BN32 TaxID=3058432 RepID=UPI00265D17CF|nr:PstS family phosphate ABC transporter substrate-binding protein [Sphingobacterium sp. BN32]WKK60402.1 PstS family phosphate ABC transporter substrate-binding protein [Sphingobacterium sp. BN32]
MFFNSCSTNTNSIKMKGSDTEVNLAVNLAEQFTELDPTFSIAISGGGSGLGITSLMNGQADIANSSRPLSDEEIEQFKEKNIELKTIVFAEDATAFVVHKDLPLEELTVDTLGLILSGKIKNWNEIIDFDEPINIYGRQSSSGTHSFIKKKLKIEFANTAKEMTGNAQIIEGVKADKTGIGYVGAGYVAHDPNSSQKVKIVKIRENAAAIAYSPLDPEAINNSKYYFQRPLYQFVLAKSWEKVRPFINFERGGIGRKLIEEHGYYTLENQQHEI